MMIDSSANKIGLKIKMAQANFDLALIKAKLTSQQQVIDQLQAIIDAPSPKTGRVMSADELIDGQDAYRFNTVLSMVNKYTYVVGNKYDADQIRHGLLFHDAGTRNKYGEYLRLEQELRIAQAADKPVTDLSYVICIIYGTLQTAITGGYNKISFGTVEARDKFKASHTEEQLKLLIKGV